MEEEANNNTINININKPLIPNDKPKQEDNPFILPPEAETSDTMTVSKCNCGNICKIITLIILVLCSIIPVFFNVPVTTIIIILPLVLFLYFIGLYFLIKDYTIIKDENNNLLKIKENNHLCCSKEYNFSLENSAFYCRLIEIDGTNQLKTCNIMVINTLKNTNEILILRTVK